MTDTSYWQNIPTDLMHSLTPRQVELVGCMAEGLRISEAATRMQDDGSNISKRKESIVKKLQAQGYSGDLKKDQLVVDPKVSESNYNKAQRALRKSVSRYVVTWAQNATPVHENFLQSLLMYCQANNAQLIVIPGRYRNPTSVWSQNNKEDEYWCEEVAPYLMDRRIELCKDLLIMGDIKIQPTAVAPLSGLKTITGRASGVFGHPKIALETVATPQNDLPKILTTCGAVTVENYTDSKAGKKGEFHHSLGATVIEIQDGIFHLREVSACDDGSFIDLGTEYFPDSIGSAARPMALVMGDIHTDAICPVCETVTFGKGGIVETLQPESVVLHDWFDGYSGSHHHKGKVFIQYAKHHSGRHNVRGEIERTFERTKKWKQSTDARFFIIGSNHNEHLTTWLERGEPKSDPENALFYHQLMAKMLAQVFMGEVKASVPDPLKILCHENGLDDLHFIGRGDRLMFGDIDCSHHGDQGANGARGGRKQFESIGVKTVIGHSHSPGIEGGCYQVGTNSMLRLEYNNGLSSWLNTDCIIYANGKRSLIHKIQGQWRAKQPRRRQAA
jgi:DNA-binding CsgD family transcriptional regulator